MAGNLQLNLNIKVDSGNANQQIAAFSKETQDLGRSAQASSVSLGKTTTSIKQLGVSSQSTANAVAASLGSVNNELYKASEAWKTANNTAKQATSTLKVTGDVLKLFGVNNNFNKLAGEIEGYQKAANLAVNAIRGMITPTTTLANSTIGLGGNISETVGQLDAMVKSAKAAYQVFTMLPLPVQAYVVTMGAANAASTVLTGSFHALEYSITKGVPALARFTQLSSQFVMAMGKADVMALQFSSGLQRISQVLYSLGSMAKLGVSLGVISEKFAGLAGVLLDTSGKVTAANFVFNQLTKTIFGTGTAAEFISKGLATLTFQSGYVGGVIGGLKSTVSLLKTSFIEANTTTKILSLAFLGLGTATRIATGAFDLMRFAAAKLQPLFSGLLSLTAPLVGALRSMSSLLLSTLPFMAYHVVKSADSMEILKSRMKLVVTSTQELEYAQRQLVQSSVKTGSSLEANVNIFTKAAKPLRDMGLNAKSTVAVVDTLGKSLIIAGAQTSEVNSVLLQTSQMLSKGMFSGDEFMSLMENGSVVMDNLSKALGKTKGELIEMSHNQQLTSEMFAYGMLKSFGDMQRQFDTMPVTMGRAFSQLWTGIKLYSGAIADDVGKAASSISRFATNAIESLQSGQFEREMIKIQLDFKLLANDIAQTANTISPSLAKAFSIQSPFLALRTDFRVFIIEVVRGFDNALEKASANWDKLKKSFINYNPFSNFNENRNEQRDKAIARNNEAANALIAQTYKEQNAVIAAQNTLTEQGLLLRQKLRDEAKKEATELAANATAQAAAMQAGIEEKLSAAGVDKEAAKKALSEQLDGIKKLTDAKITQFEEQKAANDALFNQQKISASQHYQTELNLINQITQAKTSSLTQTSKLESAASSQNLSDLDKAYQAILKIESAGGKLAQVNQTSHALGQMQVLPSTLRDPGYGIKPFQPAIDQNITALMSYQRLLKFVQENEAGLKKFGEDYFKGLVNHYGSIDKAVNAYGEHTAAYMAKFKQYYGQISGQTEQQTSAESDLAKVRSESNKAAIAAGAEYAKQQQDYLKSVQDLKNHYIELTGTAQQAREAQLALQYENNPLRKAATLGGDKSTLDLLDKVQQAELDKEFNDRMKALQDEQLQLQMTTQQWQYYQNAKISKNSTEQNKLNDLTDNIESKKAAKKTLEYKISFKDKELTNGLAKAQKLATGLQNSFGKVGKSIGDMAVAMANYGKVSNDIEVQRAAVTKENGANAEQIAIAQTKAAQEQAIAQIDAYASMTEAAQGFFKEGTAGYQLMGIATKAFRAYEMYLSSQSTITAIADMARTVGMWVTGETAKTAATVASVAPEVAASTAKGTAKAAEAVANEGSSGDSYTAFARVAMMIALMASVGFGLGGGGAAAAATTINLAEDRQKTQGTGSVLGDATAKSKSIANSLEILKQNSDVTLPLTSAMANSLRNIESNIGGLGNQVSRAFINNPKFVETSQISSGLFGRKTTRTLADSGLIIPTQMVGDIIAKGFVDAAQYVDVQVTKTGGFFSKTKTWVERQVSAVDDETKSQFGKVIMNLVGAVSVAAGSLDKSGTDFSQVLSNFAVSIGDVSLKGLKGDALQTELEAVFGRVADDMAKYAFAGLIDFQKAGEGYFETLVRVASAVEQATVGLDRLHIKAIAYTDVVNKQGDVFAEIARQSIVAQETAAKGIADVINTLNGSGSDLIDMYKQLSAIRDTMNLNGLNGNSISSSTISGAGSVADLNSAVTAYADKYFSDAEKLVASNTNMQNQFLKLGLAMPTSTAKFRALVESIDVSSAAGQKFQGQVLSLADAFYTATDLATKAIDNLQANVTTAEDNLRKAYQTESAALKQSVDDFGGFAKSLKEYLDSLVLSDISTKTPLQKYQEAKSQFDAVNTLINTGTDAQKQEGLGKLQGATDTFLQASRAYNASSMGYVRDFATATAALNNGITKATVKQNIAQLQLNALTDQVGKLVTLNDSVLSVKDAITALTDVQKELKAAQDIVTAQAIANNAAAKAAAEKINQQAFADSESKRLADYEVSIKAAAQAANPLKIATQTSWQAGGTKDTVWENLLATFNQSHIARYGIAFNRPFTADSDATSLGASLNAQYKTIMTAQNAAAIQSAIQSAIPFIPATYDPLKKYALGGISNTAAIFGEAGPEAAVPLPDGRTIPVTLSFPPSPQSFNSNSNGDNSDVVAELKKLVEKQAEVIEELKNQNELLKQGLEVDRFGYKELLKQGESQAESLENMDRRQRAKA